MHRRKFVQKGFGSVELLLVLVIVGMLGFVGWYVVHSKSTTQDNLNNADVVSSDQAANIKNKSSAKASESTLTFKEYGVKITLTPSLKNITYTAKKVDMGDGTSSTSLFINDSELAKAIDACNTTKGSTGNFAALYKGSGTFPADPTPDIGGLYKQFDKFYVSASYPNGIPCEDSSKEDAVVASMKSLQKALSDAFKSATEVQ